MLAENFNRNGLNNLILNLEKAIKDKDNDKIKYLKYEIENFQLHQKDDTNPGSLISYKWIFVKTSNRLDKLMMENI